MSLDPSDPAPINALVRLLMATGRKQEAEQLSAKAKVLMTRRRGEMEAEAPSAPPEKPDPDRHNP
jgi:hypothetical protein